jgi:signal transduction histidine kinase
MKIHHKVIYLLIVVFVLYTLLLIGFIYYSVSDYAFTDFYKRLEIRAAIKAKIELEKSTDVSSFRAMDEEYLEKLPAQTEHIIPMAAGRTAADTGNNIPAGYLQKLMNGGDSHYRVGKIFYSGILYKTQTGEQFVVIVSAENYFYTHHIVYLRNLLFTSLAFGLLWIIFFSIVISRTMDRPIQNIINEVQKIGSENLHLRLQTPRQNDLLSQLTGTFNDMLNRLETSFETQNNFISNASHELKTPLTSIIGEADLALSRERHPEEYQKSLHAILDEAEKLDKKTKALLFLAQTGFNGKSLKFQKVRIDQLVLDVKETVQRINSDFKITLDFSLLPENPEMLKIQGNEQLLHLALSNIVINACKYSDKKPVHLALGASDTEVFVIVRDSGIGIPEKELPFIYDPYFRASNTSNYEGYGIGLPLASNIIKMHKGRLQINSVLNEGTTVQINLAVGNYKI